MSRDSLHISLYEISKMYDVPLKKLKLWEKNKKGPKIDKKEGNINLYLRSVVYDFFYTKQHVKLDRNEKFKIMKERAIKTKHSYIPYISLEELKIIYERKYKHELETIRLISQRHIVEKYKIPLVSLLQIRNFYCCFFVFMDGTFYYKESEIKKLIKEYRDILC